MKRNSCNTNKFRLSVMLLSAFSLAAMSWSCVTDNSAKGPYSNQPLDMVFRAMVDNSITPTTRATSVDDEDSTIKPVDHDHFGGVTFYIYEHGTDKEQTEYAKIRPYRVASGTLGELSFIAPDGSDGDHNDDDDNRPETKDYYRKLNWFANDTQHEFWSWTWPLADNKMDEYFDVDLDTKPASELIIFKSSDFPKNEEVKDTPKTRDGEGDDGDDGGDEEGEDEGDANLGDLDSDWRNGEALEQLVGTKTDRQYQFNVDGRYVPLTYKHLVSKIVLKQFWLKDRTGATQKELKGRITFYGMPKRAIFFPLPEDGGAPYVTIDYTDPYNKQNSDELPTEEDLEGKENFDYDLYETVTFYINNEGGDNTNTGTGSDADSNVKLDMFYICPEVDFSKLEYKVEFVDKLNTDQPDPNYGQRGGFFGDFMSVEFKREVDSGAKDEEGNPIFETTTDRVLHAGEVMELSLTLQERSGPGTGVWIRNWNTEKLKSAMHHNRNGIYSDAEATAFRETFGYTGSSYPSEEQREEALENMYGQKETYKDDQGIEHERYVVRVYDDISISSNHFRIYTNKESNRTNDGDIMLDGMGHTLTFVDTSNHTNYPVVYIPNNVRDLYVSNGDVTIYIDKEGRLCRMNPETGKYEPTGETWTQSSGINFYV